MRTLADTQGTMSDEKVLNPGGVAPPLLDSHAMHRTASYSPSDRSAFPVTRTRFTHACGDRPLPGFTIKRGIGIGGFGEVYFAISDAGKEVALKRIQRNVDVELRGVSHCLNLKHVNLISLWDIKTDQSGFGWVVMEYVPGKSLREELDLNPDGLPLDKAAFWFRGIGAGVSYLHDRGIVHRDLKPGNVFHDEDANEVKIGDYGLSKLMSASRQGGHTETVGTFHYMAPEIGKGVYGKEIDIYALGIMLYEILTGKVPFDGESSQEIIMKHLTASPDLSQLPAGFRTLIQRALAKDPDKRIDTVRDLLNEFERIVDGGRYATGGEGSDRVGASRAYQTDIVVTGPIRSTYVTHAGPPNSHGHNSPAHNSRVSNSTSVFERDNILYITDDEMVIGEVTEIVTAEAVSDEISAEQVLVRSKSGGELSRSQRILGQAQAKFEAAWKHKKFGLPLRIAILLLIGIVVLWNANWLLPVFAIAGLAYGSWIVWLKIEKRLRKRARYQSAQKKSRDLAELKCRSLLSTRRVTFGDRVRKVGIELGFAAGVSLVLTLLIAIANQAIDKPLSNPVPFFAWFGVSALVMSGVPLVICEFAQLYTIRDGRARLLFLIVGAGVGLAVWGLGVGFGLDLGAMSATQPKLPVAIPENLQLHGEKTPVPAFVVFFAVVFAMIDWQGHGDPLRPFRLAILPVLIGVTGASIVGLLCHVPFPWMLSLTAVSLICMQMGAAWVNETERDAMTSDGNPGKETMFNEKLKAAD